MANTTQRLLLTGSAFAGTWMALGHGGLGGIIAGAVAWGVLENADFIIERVGGKFSPNTSTEPTDVDAPITPEEIAEYRRLQALAGNTSTSHNTQVDEYNDTPQPTRPKNFTFSSLLASGWRPSQEQIYLATLENGQHVYIPLKDIVHIALAGSTRQGKTSIIRQLMSELMYVGCNCTLLDPHYTPFDIEINEDWTPFTPNLLQMNANPMECKSYDRIEQVLKWASTVLLQKRIERRATSQRVGKHFFLFIDEYPAIIAEKREVQKYVSKLLREGGKYNIHLVIASQDFQVKTAFPDVGGAIRDSFSTCLYVGGDKTTVREILEADIRDIPEAQLGKGPIYLRCPSHKTPSLGYTPYTDNKAVYTLVGPSTYQPNTEELQEVEDVETDNILQYRPTTTTTTTTTTRQNGQNEHIETSSSLPSDWTEREAKLARNLYKEVKNRDTVLKLLEKKGTIADRRKELDIILQEETA